MAFGKAGWAVLGWEDSGILPERTGFSFKLLEAPKRREGDSKSSSKSKKDKKKSRQRPGGGAEGRDSKRPRH